MTNIMLKKIFTRKKDIPSKSLMKNLVDEGLISETDNKKSESSLFDKLGEMSGVLAVAYDLKPLAALDFTTYGKNKIKKLDIKLINKVIDFCNKRDVKYIHYAKRGGMYLKSIFFRPKNYQKAVNLMYMLWKSPISLNKPYVQFYIGKSLGYTETNIKFFIKEKLGKTLTENQIKEFNNKFNKDKYTIDDMKPLKIKIVDKILL